jgi:hypothetical protein
MPLSNDIVTVLSLFFITFYFFKNLSFHQNVHNSTNNHPYTLILRSFSSLSPCAHFAPPFTAPNHCHPLSHNQMSLSLFFHHFIFLFFYVPIQTLTTLLIHTRFGRNHAHSNRHLHTLILRPHSLHLTTATLYPTIERNHHYFHHITLIIFLFYVFT